MKGFLRTVFAPPSPIPLEVLLDSIKPTEPVEPIARLSMTDFPPYHLDPLESAITNAAQASQEAEGMTLTILQDHLKMLCDLQLEMLATK